MFIEIKYFFKRFRLTRFILKYFKKTKRFIVKFKRAKKRSRPSVIQLVNSYFKRDAIGNMVFEISNALDNESVENYIVCLDNSKTYNSYLFNEFSFLNDDILVYHMAMGSDCAEIFKESKVFKKIMIYHNITPSKFFVDNKRNRYNCDLGRRQLKELVGVPELCICVSEYNKSELVELGYKNVMVIPCIHRTDELLKLSNFKAKNDFNDTILITVGRLERNKCIEDVINLFFEYRKHNSNSILFIIGSNKNINYYNFLLNIINRLKLEKNIKLVGSISEKELAFYYSCADAYICMSEHEGFCVPLVEAMAFNVPIFAYESTAIPSTLGESGILFKTKNHKENADIMNEVLCNKNLIFEYKKREAEKYKSYNNKKTLNKYLKAFNICKKDKLWKDLSSIYKIAIECYSKFSNDKEFNFKILDFYDAFINGKWHLKNKSHRLIRNVLYSHPKIYSFAKKTLEKKI